MTTMLDLHEALDRLTYDVLHEADEDRREEFRQELMATLGEVDDKAGAYLKVIDRHEVEMAAAKAYADAHAKRAKRMGKSLEFLKGMLTETMRLRFDSHGTTDMKTPAGRWIRYYPESVKAVLTIDEDVLGDEWVKVTRAPMRGELRKAIKSGEAIPGAELVEEPSPNIRWEKM